jgi:hypothetical protein
MASHESSFAKLLARGPVFRAARSGESRFAKQYSVELIGRIETVIERFYALSVARRPKNRAVIAISEAARRELFSYRRHGRCTSARACANRLRVMPARALSLLLLLGGSVGCGPAAEARPATWRYIHPAIIKPSCATAGCHSDLSRTDDLSLERRDEALQALLEDAVDPGNSDSDLLDVLEGRTGIRMPPNGPLPREDVDLIRAWVVGGAPP